MYCWGNGNTQAEEVPLLLLPCLDYGCSRCKCVSEPLTNTNAGIKGQQQQSRQTRARTHTHTHTQTRAFSLAHTGAHTRALSLSRIHTHSLTQTHTCAHVHIGGARPREQRTDKVPPSFQSVLLNKKYI